MQSIKWLVCAMVFLLGISAQAFTINAQLTVDQDRGGGNSWGSCSWAEGGQPFSARSTLADCHNVGKNFGDPNKFLGRQNASSFFEGAIAVNHGH